MLKGLVLLWIVAVVACCIAEGFEWSRKRRIRQRLKQLHAHEQARVVRIAERAARRKAERGE